MGRFMTKFLSSFTWSADGSMYMWVIAVVGAFGIAVGFERIYYILVRSNVNAVKFMTEVRKLVAGNNLDRAIKLCEAGKQKALPYVVLTALKRANESDELDFRAIQNAVDEATLEVIPKLQERTAYLAMIANIATLIGLMGTIYGLILSFDAVSSEGIPEADKTKYLANGISAAMSTTIWGLTVAIPTLIIYTIINVKTQKIIDEMDEHLVKLINLITGNR